MNRYIEPTIIILSLILVLLFFIFKKLKSSIGFKPQKVVYQDTGEAPVLFSQKYSLCGKPDYIVKEKGFLIPVEVKSTDKLYDTHIAQLLAYCLLVEENFAKAPPYGLLKLRGREEKISYDRKAKEEIFKIITQIRKKDNFNRSHQSYNRCQSCLVAEHCDQKLTRWFHLGGIMASQVQPATPEVPRGII